VTLRSDKRAARSSSTCLELDVRYVADATVIDATAKITDDITVTFFIVNFPFGLML
jgi:hypothetical protein